jgi:hypothetical protein
MNRIILAALVTSAALAGGCAGEGVYYTGGGAVTATTVAPDLVYVSPGVQVVANYEYPVFYADNYYWRYDNGLWYRSSWYTGGWAYATPPRTVMTIDRPYAYRYYRPSGYASGGAYVRDHRSYREPVYRDSRTRYEGGPVYRDNRQRYEGGPVYRGGPAPSGGPVMRDHREVRPAPAQPAPATRTERDHRERRAVVRDHR